MIHLPITQLDGDLSGRGHEGHDGKGGDGHGDLAGNFKGGMGGGWLLVREETEVD